MVRSSKDVQPAAGRQCELDDRDIQLDTVKFGHRGRAVADHDHVEAGRHQPRTHLAAQDGIVVRKEDETVPHADATALGDRPFRASADVLKLMTVYR